MAAHRHINRVLSGLEEAERRWYVASLWRGAGAASDQVLAQISGLSDKTIARGRQELEADLTDAAEGRPAGGGRKKAEKKTRR